MKKKAALHNLGCKVNAYEVEAMQQLFGYRPGMKSYLLNLGQMFM